MRQTYPFMHNTFLLHVITVTSNVSCHQNILTSHCFLNDMPAWKWSELTEDCARLAWIPIHNFQFNTLLKLDWPYFSKNITKLKSLLIWSISTLFSFIQTWSSFFFLQTKCLNNMSFFYIVWISSYFNWIISPYLSAWLIFHIPLQI